MNTSSIKLVETSPSRSGYVYRKKVLLTDLQCSTAGMVLQKRLEN